jgi:plasmid maintenance system killer protein
MIKSFQNKETERMFSREVVKSFSPILHKQSWRKFALIDAA